MARVCANCGTEVDDEALFCPTCGQPMRAGAEPELPPAPDWPDARPAQAPAGEAEVEEAPGQEPPAGDERPAPASSEPEAHPHYHAELGAQPRAPDEVPPWRRGSALASGRAPGDQGGSLETRPTSTARPQDPFGPSGLLTTPETLAGWLVGAGAALAFIALLLPWHIGGSYVAGWGLASGVNVLIGLVLLGVLAVIFLATTVPGVPQRDLAFAAFGMLGVGIGLDRLAMPLTGVGATLFLIGMLAVAAGGLTVLLGFDRSVGGARP